MMQRKWQVALVLTAMVLAACVPTTQMTATPTPLSADLERKAQRVARYNLVDPDSGRFRSTRGYRLQTGDIVWCGERNARNRAGGYVGFKPFYVRFDPRSLSDAPINEQTEFLAQTACTALARGQSIPIRDG